MVLHTEASHGKEKFRTKNVHRMVLVYIHYTVYRGIPRPPVPSRPRYTLSRFVRVHIRRITIQIIISFGGTTAEASRTYTEMENFERKLYTEWWYIRESDRKPSV